MSRCGERVTRDAAHYHTVFNDNIYKQGWGEKCQKHDSYISGEMWRNGRWWETSTATRENGLMYFTCRQQIQEYNLFQNENLTYLTLNWICYILTNISTNDNVPFAVIQQSRYSHFGWIHIAFWNSLWAGRTRPFQFRYRNIWKWQVEEMF